MSGPRYKISTEQVRHTGDILGIAVVERLDRIVQLLGEIRCGAYGQGRDDEAAGLPLRAEPTEGAQP